MSNPVPHIFDRDLLRRRRARVAPDFAAHAFLAERAADELSERIDATGASFDLAAAHGARAPVTPAVKRWIRSDETPAIADTDTQATNEEHLPFAPATLDLYVSLLTLHAVNDVPGVLAQVRRALKPDGLFLAAMFGGETLKELRHALAEAELEIDDGLSPRVFPFVDVRDIGAVLQRTGFGRPIVDVDTVTVRYEHPLKLMAELRGMAETNVLVERHRTFLKRRTLARACEIYLEQFADKDGRVPATFEILYLTGWASHDARQRPLGADATHMRLR